MSYSLNTDQYGTIIPGIRRDADGATIPEDQDNRDWQTYLAWLVAGNQPRQQDGARDDQQEG